MRLRRGFGSLLSLVLAAPFAPAQAPPPYLPGTLTFQTDQSWSPRANINGDTVMVYGIDDTLAERVRSWHAHGYRVTVMTGVAWGRYAPYLRGDFDGQQHWNETQQEGSGKLILHGGREVPYISPTPAYGRFLAHGVETALDAGAEAIYLEEPEFWARAGWSDSFKQSWQEIYHDPWQPPDSSPDAQYRASRLKYLLYRRTLAQIFAAVKQYGDAHHRSIGCYVATHSLINYAQWDIVSPESSLLSVGADGYIAQVWTGTARAPNVFRGQTRQRTFETAFLEYGALENIARSSGKPIWYLNDPIEDNPNHSWTDYKANWESTLIASLLQPEISRYELVPWPERVFGEGKTYPAEEPTATNPNPPRTTIPATYATELQNVFHALGEMKQPAAAVHWKVAGSEGLGVLISDSLMFQRAAPDPSDPDLSQFYGLALPPLFEGMPIEPVQIESTYAANGAAFLSRYKLLLLSYDGQKPPSPGFHTALAHWVRNGGALVIYDDDRDPYNKATDWWNTGSHHDATPRDDLFRQLGLDPASTGLHRVGQGIVLYQSKSPVDLAYAPGGADELMGNLAQAASAVHLSLRTAGALVLQRGPYLIAAGLDTPPANAPLTTLHGHFIDLFSPGLDLEQEIRLQPGTRVLLFDLDRVTATQPKVLAASGKVTGEHEGPHALDFTIGGIDQTTAIVRLLLKSPIQDVQLDGKPLPAGSWTQNSGTAAIRFTNSATPQHLTVHLR